MSNLHFYPTEEIHKSGDRSHLIPVKKSVTRNGKTFIQTFWCKPVDAASFKATAPAVEFLLKTVESQKMLSEMVDKLASYNQGLAAQIYNEMIKSGEKSVKIANQVVSISEWNTQRETNISTFMAGIKHLLNSKGQVNMADLASIYENVSYQYHMIGLDITEEDKSVKKLGVTQELTPIGWTDKVKDVGAAIRNNIKAGLETVRVLYRKLDKEAIPVQPEELDYRRKENLGKLDNLYVSYQGKKTLTDSEREQLAGVKPKPLETGKKKLVVTKEPKQKPEADLNSQLEAIKLKLLQEFMSWANVPKKYRDKVKEFERAIKEVNHEK